MAVRFAASFFGTAMLAIGVTLTSPIGATDQLDVHSQKARVAHDLREVSESEVDKLAAEPWRAHFGRTDVYIPTFFHAVDGKYDLIVHFHGLAAAQESNIERSRVNAVVASINIGVGSGPYENAFKDAWVFPQLVKTVEKAIAKSGRAKGAHLGRLALSAWSAGYGSVSAILRSPSNARRIDALLLADGLHSDYVHRGVVDDAPLQKYAKIADAATKGEKLFALTHSSITIPDHSYPNTTETIGELIRLVGGEKQPLVADGPRGMSETYECHKGDFHVIGFLGTGVKDHIDHIWGMNETLLPYLRDRWGGETK